MKLQAAHWQQLLLVHFSIPFSCVLEMFYKHLFLHIVFYHKIVYYKILVEKKTPVRINLCNQINFRQFGNGRVRSTNSRSSSIPLRPYLPLTFEFRCIRESEVRTVSYLSV